MQRCSEYSCQNAFSLLTYFHPQLVVFSAVLFKHSIQDSRKPTAVSQRDGLEKTKTDTGLAASQSNSAAHGEKQCKHPSVCPGLMLMRQGTRWKSVQLIAGHRPASRQTTTHTWGHFTLAGERVHPAQTSLWPSADLERLLPQCKHLLIK